MKTPLKVEENNLIGKTEVVISNSTLFTPPIKSPGRGNWHPLAFSKADKLQVYVFVCAVRTRLLLSDPGEKRGSYYADQG